MDERGKDDFIFRCKHVNLVTKRVAGLPDEQEYLFVPYSAFTVTGVERSPQATYRNPHIIRLEAAVDGRDVSDTVELAPWG